MRGAGSGSKKGRHGKSGRKPLVYRPGRSARPGVGGIQFGTPMPAHFPLQLTGSRMLAPSVRHLVFARADGLPLDFIPGQFIQVHFTYPDGTPTKRSYSLATMHDHALGPGESVQIAVSYVAGGAATAIFT